MCHWVTKIDVLSGFDALVHFIESSDTRRLKKEIIQIGGEIRNSANPNKEKALFAQRSELLDAFRARYYALGEEKTAMIKSFLSVVNREIVMAKAMFLAYADPFEK